MSKSIHKSTASTASTSEAVHRVSQSYVAAKTISALDEIEASMHLTEALTPPERRTLTLASTRVPDALIEALAAVAARHDGTIVGVPFDATAARETIARTAASTAILTTLERITRRLRDHVLHDRGELASQVETRVAFLRSYATTTEGAAYREDADVLKAILQNTPRARAARKTNHAKRATATATTTATPTPTPTPTAPTTPTTTPTPHTA